MESILTVDGSEMNFEDEIEEVEDDDEVRPGQSNDSQPMYGELLVLEKTDEGNEDIDVEGDEECSTMTTSTSTYGMSSESCDGDETNQSPCHISQKKSKRKKKKKKRDSISLSDIYPTFESVPKIVTVNDVEEGGADQQKRQLRIVQERHRRSLLIRSFVQLQSVLIESEEPLWSKSSILLTATSTIADLKRCLSREKAQMDDLLRVNSQLRYRYLIWQRDHNPSNPPTYPPIVLAPKKNKHCPVKAQCQVKEGMNNVRLLTRENKVVPTSFRNMENTDPTNMESIKKLVIRRNSTTNIPQVETAGPSKVVRTASADGLKRPSEVKVSNVVLLQNKNSNENAPPNKKGSFLKPGITKKSKLLPKENPSLSVLQIETIELLSSEDEN